MTIHIFNPEHDMALASGLEHFTAPHAGRDLRHDLGFLPVLWAKKDDIVLVDDIDSAKEALRHLNLATDGKFVDKAVLSQYIHGKTFVSPWGWDAPLRQQMKSLNIADVNLPSNGWLNAIRLASHRAWAAQHLLSKLHDIDGTIGESFEVKSVDELRVILAREKKIVLKAPWSCSGRGIRYVEESSKSFQAKKSVEYGLTDNIVGWINNVIRHQGCVMVEPYYNKVCDFGMEFVSRGGGVVDYRGLSLFHTNNGAYIGNVLDGETQKLTFLQQFIPNDKLHTVAQCICSLMATDLPTYIGPFGVDMMVVKHDGHLLLNPCVELNLRMTMGHVALLITEKYGMENKVMRIAYSGNKYRLMIEDHKIFN